VAVVFFVLAFRKKEKIISILNFNFKIRFKALRAIILFAGLGLMVFSLLGPQVFQGYVDLTKTGLDIYVITDTSKSMLVTDITPDRITIAKRTVENLMDGLNGDRIGFIPFAAGAYIQMPLTDDYQLARMFLDVMDTDMISGGGTNIAAALRLANDSFNRSSSADRVILILSDEEEQDGASLDVLDRIADEQLRIFTIGIGTERGGLIPVYNNAGIVVDFMKDETGNPVTSRLNADLLIELAQRGNGSYFQATLQGTEVSLLLDELSALKRDNMTVESIRRFNQIYQYFLGAGILLFIIAWLMPEGRKPA